MSRPCRIFLFFPHVVSVVMLLTACCVSPLFGQDWVPLDPPQPETPSGAFPTLYPPPYGSVPVSASIDLPPSQPVDIPDFSPDDPQLAQLLEARKKEYAAANQAAEENAKQQERLQQQKKAITQHIYESRKQEIVANTPRTSPNGAKAGLDVFTFPELDGSTSCANLGAIVTARVLRVPYAWEAYGSQGSHTYYNPRFRRTNFSTGTMYHQPSNSTDQMIQFQIVADRSKATFRQRNIFRDYFGQFQGTHQSYMSLIGPPKENTNTASASSFVASPSSFSSPMVVSLSPISRSDDNFPASEIILVARKPSQDEQAAAERAGVELDVRPVARDAFIFVVSRKNPVESLTLEQIRSIFASQQQRKWNEFGGNDAPVMPYERERNSGSREIMDELVVTPEVLEKYSPPQPANELQPVELHTTTETLPPVQSWAGGPATTPSRVQPFGAPPTNRTPSTTPGQAPLSTQVPHFANYPTPEPQNNVSSTFSSYSGVTSATSTTSQPHPAIPTYQPPAYNPSFRDHRPNSNTAIWGMGAPFMMVQQNQNTIAYSIYHYEHFMNCSLDTRVLAVDGVRPSLDTIRSGEYPLCCDVYVVTRKGIDADSPAAKLRDWLLSEDGQNCIAESGYVPLKTSRK